MLPSILRLKLVVCAFLLAYVPVSSVAQSNARNQATTPPNSQFSNNNSITLDLEDADIRDLIGMVAEVTGKNFVVDPRIKGKVSVVSGKSLNGDELYDIFLKVLEVSNFSAVDTGNIIKILPANEMKQQPTPTEFTGVTEGTQRGDPILDDEQTTQVITLKFAPVQELVPIIRPLIPPTSHFAPHTPSNSLVITDTRANIQRILQIIRRIDVPDKRSNIRVVLLQHAKASDLANTIRSIFSKAGNAAKEPQASKATVEASDAINALIISSPDDEYGKIAALIAELDIERQLESDATVIYLRHAKAEDMVKILNDSSRSGTPESINTFSVQADEATNSLIVKASGNKLNSVKSVVEKLDIRRAQVFVETVIAEVSLTESGALGVNWNFGDAENPVGLVDENNQAIGSVTGGTQFSLGSGGLNFALLDYDKYKLDVIVNALRSDENSNILSTPNVLTLDNEPAEIVVGQEVPFITSRQSIGSTDNLIQNIERKDVGIKLKITPQINQGGTIQMEVEQEISSVASTTIGDAADLITNRRSITAMVQADDGQVVVLGGLIQDDVTDTLAYVPILGKIPIIGNLFRNKSKDVIKRNLMVFIKPTIVRDSEGLTEFSRTKYEDIRRHAFESEKHDSDILIPGIMPDARNPVLDEYDNVVGDGHLGTIEENRLRQLELIERDEAAEEALEDFRTGDEAVEDFSTGDEAVEEDFDTGDKEEEQF